MKFSKKTTLCVLTTAILWAYNVQAREQIRIVGSSTVYPFSSAVAEELGATSKVPTPVVESTGTGGGMKLFCQGDGLDTPDIVNASRRMQNKEFDLCQKNGVTNITEVMIGFDGIVFAQNKANGEFNVTKEQLLLAVAEEVPSKDGQSLVKNPYKFWHEIDPALPKREIIIYGPPKSSGTRDAFEEMVLKEQTKHMDIYSKLYEQDKEKNKAYKEYSNIRTDGIYVPSGENDNIIVQKLSKNKVAFGVFGYSFLLENQDQLNGTTVSGVAATPETISDGSYPISRSLFFYIKNTHEQEVPSLKAYVDLFMSENIIGQEGTLTEIGLIPLPDDKRASVRESVSQRTKLSRENLSQ
jgi:phosphate transport system substrate-binding protein